MSPEEVKIRKKLRDDFPHFAAKCLKIRTKKIQRELPFLVLNEAQRYIHERAQDQMKRRGLVRMLLLKSRQQGGSTYIQGRMIWRTIHNKGMRGYIMAHKDDSTSNMFKMAKIYYENLPDLVKPSRAASNQKELDFDKLNSGYKVATAGGKDSGRSDTTHFLHLSEAGYFPDAETTMAGVLEAVPEAEGTEIWIESTSAGKKGRFYEMCNDVLTFNALMAKAKAAEAAGAEDAEKLMASALQAQTDYELIFIPWYWSKEYMRHVPAGFKLTDDEAAYRDELEALTGWRLSDEQLYWRRMKIVTLKGIAAFRREYPATPEEAFKVEVPGALWKDEMFKRDRVAAVPEDVQLVRVVVGVDPSGGHGKRNDEQGIVAAGLGSNGHGYVLEDGSCKKTPAGWGKRAVDMFHAHKADRVVWEGNFGGEMVEFVIQTADPRVPTKGVSASRGKLVRAEPVASLYEKGLVHHVGTHYMLEDECTTWNPLDPSQRSPNRVDALVWVITELMLGASNEVFRKSYEV